MKLDAIREVVDRWRRDAERFRQYGDERGAQTCELHADELDSAVRDYLTEPLTVAEAHEETGYSESHLRALLGHEKLANVGCEGAPRIRRSDLPKKPTPARRASLAEESIASRTGTPRLPEA